MSVNICNTSTYNTKHKQRYLQNIQHVQKNMYLQITLKHKIKVIQVEETILLFQWCVSNNIGIAYFCEIKPKIFSHPSTCIVCRKKKDKKQCQMFL